MGADTAAAQQVDKKPYKNQTAGWISVVRLDHLGAQQGTPVAPFGVAWLSDDEATLTARAPAQAKDNPFIAKPFRFQDEKGNEVIQDMAPLILLNDEEAGDAAEADRFVPGRNPEGDLAASHDINFDAVAASRRDTDGALNADSDRPVPTEPVAATPVPASSAAVHPSLATVAPSSQDDERASWVDNPDRTADPQPGSLGGSNEQVGPSDEDAARDGTEQQAPPGPPMPQQPPTAPADDGAAPVASSTVGATQAAPEEHAGLTQAGEETGAADTPAGAAPEGEFAAHEEVGSPDAPSADGEQA